MISKTYFEESLCQDTRLFSISKTETDLFLLLQTTIITYEQLHATQLHGKTEAAGRLSLKRLEKSGLIQAKSIACHAQTKYYFLTAKGKNYAKQLFSSVYLETIHANFDRRIPSGHQQLTHRIRTNDFYFNYIGYSHSIPLPWQLEVSLSRETFPEKTPARCDGHLSTPFAQYFIEQDNNTQTESVLLQKIAQYQSHSFFEPDNSNKQVVFCLAFPKHQPLSKKPSHSLYKILLRMSKLWTQLEKEQQLTLDYEQFLQFLDSPQMDTSVSSKEKNHFRQIHAMHPDADSLCKINLLKKAYLDDTTYFETQYRELDLCFQKRLKSHYRRFYNNSSVLLTHAYSGKSIFAIPNHRLACHQPYVMCQEYLLPEYLLNSLIYSGLNTDGWNFLMPMPIDITGGTCVSMRMGYRHLTYGSIIFELYPADLAAIHRLRYLVRNSAVHSKTIAIILIGQKIISEEIQQLASSAHMKNIHFLFARNFNDVTVGIPLRFYLISHPQTPVAFECDDFDELFRILPKEGLPC